MYRKGFIDKYLKNGFSFEEAKVEVDFALEVLFNYTYKDFMLGKIIEPWQLAKLEKVFNERVLTHKPIQQIIGQAFFYGRKFFVNEHTLIPRPETELLVEKVLEVSREFQNPKILDIGAGSGCIPIILALQNKDISAQSVDISKEAVVMAEKNALLHNVREQVKFYQSDLFENVNDEFDIIVSNPPYIPLRDKENLQIEVRDFDPPNALFTKDDDGIEFYEKIAVAAKNYLNGYLFFEIGINQSEKVEKILKINNYKDVKVVKDFNLIDRIVYAKHNY